MLRRIIGVRTATVGLVLMFPISLGAHRATEITFSKDVAPIFYNRCINCHHPNDVAPMSLLNYREARPWAKSIREAVATRRMPPWHADSRFGRFENDPSLSQEEIATIRAWVDQGAKEGDRKDLPVAPVFTEGWRISKPDAIISMPAVYNIASNGPDDYQNFPNIPTNFKEDVWIKAIELRPGNRRAVHHAHVFLTPPKLAKLAKSAKSAKNGPAAGKSLLERYTYMEQTLLRMRLEAPVIDDACRDIGEGGLPDRKFHEETQILTTYVPGRAPEVYPDGYARLIPAGSTIGFQIHYAKGTGKEEQDRTSVGLIFFDNSANNPANPDPTKTVRWGAPTTDEMAASWVAFELTEEPTPQTQHGNSQPRGKR